jgi:hypothetical protein
MGIQPRLAQIVPTDAAVTCAMAMHGHPYELHNVNIETATNDRHSEYACASSHDLHNVYIETATHERYNGYA